MRIIEKQMLEAVVMKRDFEKANTKVFVSGDKVKVYLYGNLIYTNRNGVVRFSLCGWNTVTTRSRLNALGIHVVKRSNLAYLVSGSETKLLASYTKYIAKPEKWWKERFLE